MSDDIIFVLSTYGLTIVISFLVALLIRGIVLVLPWLDRPGPEAAAAPHRPAGAAQGIPPAHIAAIAAAVSQALPSHRIVHIENRSGRQEWSAEGRMIHQTSHNLPPGRR